MDFQDIRTGTKFAKNGGTFIALRDVQRDQFSISNGLKVFCLDGDGEECYVLGHPFEMVQ